MKCHCRLLLNFMYFSTWCLCLLIVCFVCSAVGIAEEAQRPKQLANAVIEFPPRLPNGRTVVTDTSPDFLKPPTGFSADIAIAKTAPTIDFAYFPGQDYAGKPWSNWGDSLAMNGKYYASIGDHLSALGGAEAARSGNALVYEYDPTQKSFRQLANVAALLSKPAGHYVPGKIHSRLDLGSDGWLYYSTHRGSTKVTTDAFHYTGDWIMRCNPTTGRDEIVTHAPVPKHCIPTSVFDPDRLIFYGGTAPGAESKDPADIQFFAYDIPGQKLLYCGLNGPARCMIFARSSGRVYFVPGKEEAGGTLVRFDPKKPGTPEPISAELGLRAATQETPQGIVYTVSKGSRTAPAELCAFNTKTEAVEKLGPAAVGSAQYITSIDADASGRYLYYVPGAHGGAERDGTPVVQFDTMTKTRKVIAFLHPFYQEQYGVTLVGTFSSAIDPAGDKLYVTWNATRGGKVWDCCALTVIHLPPAERTTDE